MADLTQKPIVTLGDSIYLLSAPGTWGAAQAEAQSFGGNLVTINNEAEQTFLAGLFAGQDLWIGYNDAGVEGTFQWANGENSVYTNWAKNQPDDAYQQDFAILSSNGSWDDQWGTRNFKGIIEIKNATTPIFVIEDLGIIEPGGNSAQALFQVKRFGNSSSSSSVNYSTANGTANAGTHYTATSGTLTFNPGETVKTISVTVNRDADATSGETFFVDLSSPTNAIFGDTQAKAKFREAPEAVTFGGHTYLLTTEVNWGEAQVQARSFGGNLVTINSAEEQAFLAGVYAGQNLWIGYSDAGKEWDAKTEEGFQWVSGENSAYTNWAKNQPDDAYQQDFAILSSNGSWDDQWGTRNFKGIIEIPYVAVDSTPTTLTIAINDPSVVEATGKAAFTVTLSQASGQSVSVDYQTVNGSAIAGADYTPVSGRLTFAAGETTKVIEVPIRNDNIKEPDETFSLTLSNATGASISDSQGVGTIRNDDHKPPGNQILKGDADNNILVGDVGDDQLFGNAGQDSLNGVTGNDLLCGGAGVDVLIGGIGRDRFLFDLEQKFAKAQMGIDQITDFTKEDKIVLDRTTFTQLKKLSFATVKNTAQAKTSEASITYIRSTGSIFYNANGKQNGFGAGGLFADLANGLSLAKSDLVVVK